MKKRLALTLSGSLFALSTAAFAAPRDGLVDIYYNASAEADFEIDGADVETDGDGYGVRAIVPVGQMFLVTGEYLKNSYDEATVSGLSGEIDFDADEWRVGGGIQSTPDRARLAAYVDYIKLTLDGGSGEDDADGFGLHLRGSYDFSDQLGLYGEAGYVRLEDDNGDTADGPEFVIGGSFAFDDQFGAFAEYRTTRIEPDSDTKIELNDVRVGLRLFIGS